ncbi:Uncharacterised protein [Mycobacterium tuberculosis]|nr:Uncharacterised protein [Mycobacterium tuberculosis]
MPTCIISRQLLIPSGLFDLGYQVFIGRLWFFPGVQSMEDFSCNRDEDEYGN